MPSARRLFDRETSAGRLIARTMAMGALLSALHNCDWQFVTSSHALKALQDQKAWIAGTSPAKTSG